MGKLEFAMELAESQADRIAKVINKNPRDVKAAIAQGKKILPQILDDPTPSGGAKILNDMGVDKGFVDSAFKKFGKYGSKIGLNQSSIQSAVDSLEQAMDGRKRAGSPKQPKSRKSNISDLSQYTLIK